VPTGNGAAGKKEPDLVKLSDILEEFNQRYGGVDWEYPDKVKKDIDELPKELAENESFANAVLHADESTVQIEGGDALQQIIVKNMAARSELFRIFLENQEFQNFLVERVINAARTMVRATAR